MKTLLFILFTFPLFVQQDKTLPEYWNSYSDTSNLFERGYIASPIDFADTFPTFTYQIDSIWYKEDTIIVEGLGLYISDDVWDYGLMLELLPTQKKVATDMWSGYSYSTVGGMKVPYYKKTLEVWQYKWNNETYVFEWALLDMTVFKELLFIQKRD